MAAPTVRTSARCSRTTRRKLYEEIASTAGIAVVRRPDRRGRRAARRLRPARRDRPGQLRQRAGPVAARGPDQRPVPGRLAAEPAGRQAARGVLPVGVGVRQPRPDLAAVAARLGERAIHLPARDRHRAASSSSLAQRVRGGDAHRAAAGRPGLRGVLAMAALRDIVLARARRQDAHALPAQRPAQLGHAQVRRRGDRPRRRGAHPRRVLQPDDRRGPPGRGDPATRRTSASPSRSASRPSSPTSSTSSSAPGSGPARSPTGTPR